jgi:diguanylate cyclase (GGDEF)-like protein/hemerythrin-like metal-binding protein/PAS domain S-box-containing protein
MAGFVGAVEELPFCAAIFESMPSGIVVQDRTGAIVSANPAAQRILGLSLDQMRGVTSIDPAWQALHEDGSAFPGETHPAMQVLRSGQPARNVVMGIFNPRNDSHTWIKVNALPLHEPGEAADAAIQGVYSFFEDITHERLVEDSLREKNAEFRLAIQTSSDGFWMVNMQGRLLEVNDAYAQLSGYSRDELLQMHIPQLDSYDGQGEVMDRMQRIVQSGQDRFNTVHRAKDGRRWPVEVVASYAPLGGGRVFCLIKDITAQQLSAELIWHQANFDPLTDLPNRALFFDRLSQECAAARRNGKRVALLFADLDAFKAVNDLYGHAAGDAVLKTVAARWLACVRGSDTIARLGGDEFAIIVGNLESTEEASAIASKIIATLEQPIELGGGKASSVGVSLGVAVYPDNAVEMDSLLQAADKAMYVCKSSGTRAIVFSDKQSAEPLGGPNWIVFSETHLIGVEEIDEQHRQLVRMVNELNQDIAASAGNTARITRCFDELINFTVSHFKTEHRYMVDYGYAQTKAHDFEHGQLVSELSLILQTKRQDGDLLVLQRIKDWLLNHILTADKALGHYLNEKGVC